MRDHYDDDYDVAEGGHRVGWRRRFGERISTWTGALLAAAIIVALVLWGYRLSEREISAIPVIHAAQNQAKVQPDDTGASEAANQDIRSYGAGTGETTPPTIAYAPPPERPAAEDVAMGALPENGAAPAATANPGAADPVAAVLDGSDLAPVTSAAAPVRPADLSERMAAAIASDTAEVKLAAQAASSRVKIQLGAFPSREFTEAEWKRIQKANEDILTGRTLVVQSTISGGRRFFRLRAGPFKDRVEAQSICRALQARKQDCLVAVND
jgi:hypothetical protein